MSDLSPVALQLMGFKEAIKSEIVAYPTFKDESNFKIHFQLNMKFKFKQILDLWEHTIVKVIKCDLKFELRLMLKQWVNFNKLENFNSILNYNIDNFKPSGNFRYINGHGEI